MGTIYRPPNASLANFLDTVSDIIESFTPRQKCYLIGDSNLNLLKNNANNVSDFINLMYTHSFFLTITKPTRVTRTSVSIIDHIWTNDLNNYKVSGIIHIMISDHFPVFTTIDLPDMKFKHSVIKLKKRKYNNESISSFKSDLMQYKWELDMIGQDVNEDFNTYMDKYLQLYNVNFLIKEYEIKEKHIDKSYITHAIQNSIKHRNKLQKLYAKWPLTNEETFKKYRNTLTSVIR